MRDPRLLDVVGHVLESGLGVYADPVTRAWLRLGERRPRCGLPVGAFTSQALASWPYLDALDQHVKRTLKVPAYVRYVDDLFVFGPSRDAVERRRDDIGRWLDAERRLVLKPPAARVRSCRGVLHGLGVRITLDGIAPLPRRLRQLGGVARAAAFGGRIDRARFRRGLAARMVVLTFG